MFLKHNLLGQLPSEAPCHLLSAWENKASQLLPDTTAMLLRQCLRGRQHHSLMRACLDRHLGLSWIHSGQMTLPPKMVCHAIFSQCSWGLSGRKCLAKVPLCLLVLAYASNLSSGSQRSKRSLTSNFPCPGGGCKSQRQSALTHFTTSNSPQDARAL